MHNNWFTFIIAVFAVYRVGRMVAEEDGPMFLFKDLRDRFSNDKRSFDKGIRCFYCVSVWAALVVALVLVILDGWDVWLWPLWWLGIAGGACKIYEFWRRG